MIALEEARRTVLDSCSRLDPVVASVTGSSGCVLADTARARVAVPPFANSAMDGYALRSADVSSVPATLDVVDTVLAGSNPSVPVGPGQAVRIMTGAPVPKGADAVCMIERTHPSGDGSSVAIEASVAPGDNIRQVGEDVSVGDAVLDAGVRVGPSQLAALVSAGCVEVRIYPKPRVAVISTGDELVEPGSPLTGGHIYDSNRPMLLAMVEEAGCLAVDFGRASDDETDISGRIEGAIGEVDALVLSGGVSVGDVDLVRVVLDKLGAGTGRSMQIAVRPAKPFSFALLDDASGVRRVPAFGLPGNPVSAAVSFELLVRPALRMMAGHGFLDRPRVAAQAASAFRRKPDGKIHFVRVRLEREGEQWLAYPCLGQGSHQIRSMALADGLAVLPDGDGVGNGEVVEIMVLNTEFR